MSIFRSFGQRLIIILVRLTLIRVVLFQEKNRPQSDIYLTLAGLTADEQSLTSTIYQWNINVRKNDRVFLNVHTSSMTLSRQRNLPAQVSAAHLTSPTHHRRR